MTEPTAGTDITPRGVGYYDDGEGNPVEAQNPVPVAVHISSSGVKAGRPVTPEYANCITVPVDTFANMSKVYTILQRRYRRHKARILIPSLEPITITTGDSMEVEGNVTTPGANANIAVFTAGQVPAGTYSVQWTVEYDGTPGAGEVDNMKFVSGGTTVTTATCDGAVGRYVQPTMILNVAANSLIGVKSVSAGTAGAEYTASVTLTPVIQGTAGIVFNSRAEPLMQAIPVGFTVTNAPYELQWDAQKPLFAVLQPTASGPINVSVLDQAYEET